MSIHVYIISKNNDNDNIMSLYEIFYSMGYRVFVVPYQNNYMYSLKKSLHHNKKISKNGYPLIIYENMELNITQSNLHQLLIKIRKQDNWKICYLFNEHNIDGNINDIHIKPISDNNYPYNAVLFSTIGRDYYISHNNLKLDGYYSEPNIFKHKILDNPDNDYNDECSEQCDKQCDDRCDNDYNDDYNECSDDRCDDYSCDSNDNDNDKGECGCNGESSEYLDPNSNDMDSNTESNNETNQTDQTTTTKPKASDVGILPIKPLPGMGPLLLYIGILIAVVAVGYAIYILAPRSKSLPRAKI